MPAPGCIGKSSAANPPGSAGIHSKSEPGESAAIQQTARPAQEVITLPPDHVQNAATGTKNDAAPSRSFYRAPELTAVQGPWRLQLIQPALLIPDFLTRRAVELWLSRNKAPELGIPAGRCLLTLIQKKKG